MKRNVQTMILSTLMVLITLSITAQNKTHWCGTDHDHEFMERLTRNVKFARENDLSRMDITYIPVKFHLIADNEGNGRISEQAVYQQLCRHNEQFAHLNMQFYVHEGFSYVDNTSMYNHTGNAQQQFNALANQNRGVMNLFIPLNASAPTVAGYYTGGGDFMVIRQSSFSEETNGVFGHEVGHMLNLAHPHWGWEDEPYTPERYGDMVTINTISSSQSPIVTIEVMNDPNCHLTGDRICDTPPDYGFTQNGGNGPQVCHNPWEGIVRDRNGVLIEGQPDLIMGYNGNCQQLSFTEGQGEAMKADVVIRTQLPATALRHFNTSYTPAETVVEAIPAKIAPGHLSTTEFFNNVVLQWEAVANAQGYIINIGGNANETIFIEDPSQTEYLLSDLEANSTYTWSIYPIHENGICPPEEASNLFFTSDAVTSVNEIESISDFIVFPNPVSDQYLNVSLDLEESLDVNVGLYNLAGQSVIGLENHALNSGNNRIRLNVTEIPTGIYHLNITSEKGIITERILID